MVFDSQNRNCRGADVRHDPGPQPPVHKSPEVALEFRIWAELHSNAFRRLAALGEVVASKDRV